LKKTTAQLCLIPAALMCALSVAHAQTSLIPQVVDGGPWQTTIVITNTGSTQVAVSITFFQNTSGGSTSSWALAFTENVQPQALIVQGGSSIFLHTPDTAANTTVGWGQVSELDNAGTVVAYAIFTQRGAVLGIGTAPASAAASRILVPFDNTNGADTSMAIATASASGITINVGLRMGGSTSQPTAIPLPANGHVSFRFVDQFPATAGQSGLAEFYSPSGSFAILALKFQSGALTTSPVYTATGPPLIASTSSGGGGGGNTAGNIVMGGFSATHYTASFAGFSRETSGIGGQFASYTPAEWQIPLAAQTFGPCSVLDVTNPINGKSPYGPDSFLDAGTISLTGTGIPQGATLTKNPSATGPSYFYMPAIGTQLANGGTFTISNGSGGPQVGPFSVSATLPSSFTVANWSALTSVNRGAGLTINWNGSGFDTVGISIIGSSQSNGNVHTVTVACFINPAASSGSFSVPQGALALLPAVQAGSATDVGLLSVLASNSTGGSATPVTSTSTELTPALVGGGQVNYGFFAPSVGVSQSVSIQ
jgi:hypothetical protein